MSHSIGHRRCLANIKTPRFHYQYPVLTSSMSPITHLPNELISSIADHLDYSPDINHLSQTCRHLYNILNPYLYARNVCLFCGRGLWRAVELGSEFTVLKFVVHGANKDQWTQGTPERRQREKEERRWKRRNLKGVRDISIPASLTRPFRMNFTLIRLVQDLRVMMMKKKRSLR